MLLFSPDLILTRPRSPVYLGRCRELAKDGDLDRYSKWHGQDRDPASLVSLVGILIAELIWQKYICPIHPDEKMAKCVSFPDEPGPRCAKCAARTAEIER